ncbi:MAG: tyrosine-type recombinase/integrase [Arthrospira platensis]
MSARLEKTRTPGIFKRGSRYVFSYRVDGKQRWESSRTLDEARRAKAARATDIERGEFEQHSRITLHEYAREWIERYQGTGRRGFREETRTEYRALLDKYALSHFSSRTKLTDITPRHIASFIGWLCEQTKSAATKEEPERRAPLSDKTVRNALGPLKACLATARREGLIRHNPATDVALPHRATVDDDEDRPRPFPRIQGDDGESVETMELVVGRIDQSHRLMFELLAATGLRRSELLVLEGRHLALDGDRTHVKVRQRVRRRRGEGLVIGPLKSRYSKRDVPITLALAGRLLALAVAPNELVFRSAANTVLDPDNLATRVLVPACKAAGVEWAGFHTFRHTVASRLFAEGRNVVQVQRWLGHHSASFTLDTYVHLLDNDLGRPLQAYATAPNAAALSGGLASLSG